jgi:uncharacterized protein (TIGR02147 family)
VLNIKTLFDSVDYKTYLNEWIESKPNEGRGERARLAKAIPCHAAYVSLVLSGDAHLSLEQASQVSRYLGHGEEEEDFFLMLVQSERAGNESLREYFTRKIRKARDARLLLSNRLEFTKPLSIEDQANYYGSWYYSAIHLLVGIERFQTVQEIASCLRLSRAQTKAALDFLVKSGLVVSSGDNRFRPGPANLHLASDSPMVNRHHHNWRMQAVQAMERGRVDSLHYSSVVTLSREDFQAIREVLVKAIERVRAIVKPSADETLACYAIDCFEIGEI